MLYYNFRSKIQYHSGCMDILAVSIIAIALAVIVALFAGAQIVGAQTCMKDNYNASGGKGNLNCTAKEVFIAEDPNGRKIIDAVVVYDDDCAYPYDTTTVDIVATLHFNADRFDVGIYSALDGGDGLSGECAVDPLPLSPLPATDLDGGTDICGDVVTGSGGADLPDFPFQRLELLCEDIDNDGLLDFSTCFSWRTSGSNDLCDDETDLYPGTKSKCFCERVNIPVEVPAATITVTKTINPESVDEPGDQVTFTVLVTNYSIDPNNYVTINALLDDVYGDLNGLGDCSVPQVLAGEGGMYTCSFTTMIMGNAGYSQTDTVTVSGYDSRIPPNIMEVSDDATVTVTDVAPVITVDKTAAPTSVYEPGADVTFTVVVNNNSVGNDPVTIDTLTDTIHGDLNGQGDCSVPQIIPPSGSYSCSFTAYVGGNAGDSETNVTTASGVDDEGNPVSDDDDATVTVEDATPAIMVDKTADPTSVYEPGADVTFTVVVNNNSVGNDPVTINTLTDTIHGDLNGQGDCSVPQIIPPGGSYSCSFTAYVGGNAGDSETNVTTASGVDDEGNPVSDDDDATVTVEDATPAIMVDKTADPTSVYEPGADVTFTVVVNNNSVGNDPVTINTLTDTIHGDLNGQGDCSVPQIIPPGGSYSCSFTAYVGGNAGDSETNVTTASGVDDEGNPVSDDDDATVTVEDATPAIMVDKTADPTSVYEPGADVTFSVVVNNNSVGSDPVTINTLTDSIYGDLNGQGDCSVPQTIPPGGSYFCSFTAYVSGNAGDSETNVTTASGADDDGSPVSDDDDATVTFTNVEPAASLTKTAIAVLVTYEVTVTNDSDAEALIVYGLLDDFYGNIADPNNPMIESTTCELPHTIAPSGDPNDTYTCTFNASTSTSPFTDIVTGTVSDDEGSEPVTPSDSATVIFE